MKKLANKPEARSHAKRLLLPCGPLSFSQISTYILCPRSYYFQYIQRVPRVGWTENLSLGGCAHKGLETILLQKQSGKPINDIATSRAAYTGLQHDIRRAKVSKQEVAYIDKQFKSIEKLFDLFKKDFLPKINPTAIEHSFWVMLGGFPIVLKIDLIDNNEKVTDFKLSRKMKSEYDAYQSLQLSLYSAGVEIPKASFITLKFPDLTKKTAWKPAIREVVTTKKSGDISWCEDVVASFARGIIRDSQEGCEEAFMLCDPGSWKCSPKMCDWWPMCRGKERTSQVARPDWIGTLFTDWNDLGNEDRGGEKKSTVKPDWIKDGFGTWGNL